MLNKKLTFVLIIVLAIVLSLSISAGLYISNALSKAAKDEYFWDSKASADYHILIILDASNQFYSTSFEKGIEESSELYNIAVETIRIDGSNYKEDVFDALDMAMYAEVDGVILHAFKSELLSNKINQLFEKGIPVITLNEDLPSSNRISYVGINHYNVGQVAGEGLSKLMNETGKVAIIEQGSYSDSENSEDMIVLGLKDSLKAYPELSLELIQYTEEGVLSAETVATNLFRTNPEINGIFCTDAQNTLGIVQVLIDNNLVNDIVLMGYGDDDEILSYIEKGNIIEASIVTDYEDIGREALKAFYEYINTSFVSNYLNTDLNLIDEENITNYIEEKSDSYGQVK